MNYDELLERIKSLKQKYKVKVIGQTKFKRKIFAVERFLDKSFFTAIFVAGMHARENISCDVLFKMINEGFFDQIVDFNLSFVVMANPDGVDLQQGKLSLFPKSQQKKLLKMNNNSLDFSMWKANASGVDINNNFDARFGTNVNSKGPSSHGFIGKFAESEKETQALVRYTKKIKPFLSVSYHTKGEEIYFNFFQTGKRLMRDEKIAKQFEKSTGYKIKNVEKSSSGGYKDWCVQKLKIPALTIELGSDDLLHPIKIEHLQEIFDRNKSVASDTQFAYNEFVKFSKEK